MTTIDRDLACEKCGTPGGVGHWVSNRWCCARCVLLAQLESERYVPITPPPSEPIRTDEDARREFRKLLTIIVSAVGDGT